MGNHSWKLGAGHLTYGELQIPASVKTEDEIFFSTYICHPSMANNELSGPVMAAFLAKWIRDADTSLQLSIYIYSRNDWINHLFESSLARNESKSDCWFQSDLCWRYDATPISPQEG